MIVLPARIRNVKQQELSAVVGFRNQLRILRRQVAELERSILERLEGGSKVEPGSHVAELRTERRAGKKTVRLVIN